ncbi:hypothetical protein ACFWWB_11315 [Streptomyces sp. NPDC058690]|uniref:hypothetical protein n=1 Tax=Streptomyces sp. NPDC058690 TaxID=3346600 RepID=UPI0036664487
MSVGFRPTAADNEIIQAHKRPDESTSDVLRRALRALDREKWQATARDDMDRIAFSGEDLSEEPDDWEFDAEGRPVDLRRQQSSDTSDACVAAIKRRATDRSVGEPDVDLVMEVLEEMSGHRNSSEGWRTMLHAELALAARSAASRPVKWEAFRSLLPPLPPLRVPVPALRPAALRSDLDRAVSWKLSHLRAAARRAGKR